MCHEVRGRFSHFPSSPFHAPIVDCSTPTPGEYAAFFFGLAFCFASLSHAHLRSSPTAPSILVCSPCFAAPSRSSHPSSSCAHLSQFSLMFGRQLVLCLCDLFSLVDAFCFLLWVDFCVVVRPHFTAKRHSSPLWPTYAPLLAGMVRVRCVALFFFGLSLVFIVLRSSRCQLPVLLGRPLDSFWSALLLCAMPLTCPPASL